MTLKDIIEAILEEHFDLNDEIARHLAFACARAALNEVVRVAPSATIQILDLAEDFPV